jgi:hypothetical protein
MPLRARNFKFRVSNQLHHSAIILLFILASISSSLSMTVWTKNTEILQTTVESIPVDMIKLQ